MDVLALCNVLRGPCFLPCVVIYVAGVPVGMALRVLELGLFVVERVCVPSACLRGPLFVASSFRFGVCFVCSDDRA